MVRFIPNILTVGRLVLAMVFLEMILYSPTVANRTTFLDWAFVLFVITGVTDLIDGTIARKLNVITKFGRIMDPLADKVLVCGAFICMAVIGEPKLFNLSRFSLGVIQWSIAGILIAREIYVTVLRHIAERRGVNFGATTSGKIKMFLQSFAIGMIVVKMAHVQTAVWGHWVMSITLAAMVFVTVHSGIRATRRSGWRKAVEAQSECGTNESR